VGVAVTEVAKSVVALVIFTSLVAVKVFGINSFSEFDIIFSVIGALLAIKFFSKKSPTTPNLQTHEKSELGNRSGDEKKD